MRLASLALAAALGCIFVAGCAKDAASVQCSTGIFCPAGTQCAAVQAVCLTTNCGNGKLDSGEQCDDGNIVDGDGCSSSCKTEGCGNGVIDPGEDCDPPGSGTGAVVCSATCKFEVCGNGTIDHETNPPEQCDDGSGNTDTPCATPGYSNPPSTCSTCTSSCTIHTVVGPYCGNGVCDTADGEDITTCMADCSGCGNGRIDPGEECDNGPANTDVMCTPVGYANPPTTCSTCTKKCTLQTIDGRYCGDHTCDPEENATSCPEDCAGCGNGVLDPGEQCDDGNMTSGDGCSASCKFEYCGNGIQDVNEACDPSVNDSNSTNNPAACNADCTLSSCGDGKVDAAAGEACDFGAAKNGPVTCTTYGATCPECLSSCTQLTASLGPHCGDGICDGSHGETPSTCFEDCGKCGNGMVDSGEDCDPSVPAGKTCQSVNADFYTGTLACTNCHFDVSGCVASKCGNGVVDPNEDCDQAAGTNVEACTALSPQFASGNVKCSATCQFDVSGCKASTCGNGVLDANEDCDGTKFQASYSSCASLGYENGGMLDCTNCHLDTSQCASCTDGVQDGTESAVDCGGVCTGCMAGKTCKSTSDCIGGTTCAAGTCVAIATCTDGTKDEDETDVDCGGSTCLARCATNKSCLANSDCVTGDGCVSGKCKVATCSDMTKDGNETDVDCGGSCSPCATGKACLVNGDCVSSMCSSNVCL